MVNPRDLNRQQYERHVRRRQTYEKIYRAVESHIKSRNQLGDSQTWYSVPAILFGEPLFDPERATQYVVKRLQKEGFRADSEGTLVHIDWRIDKRQAEELRREFRTPAAGASSMCIGSSGTGASSMCNPTRTLSIPVFLPENRIQEHLKRMGKK